jgi:hypothetical protein
MSFLLVCESVNTRSVYFVYLFPLTLYCYTLCAFHLSSLYAYASSLLVLSFPLNTFLSQMSGAPLTRALLLTYLSGLPSPYNTSFILFLSGSCPGAARFRTKRMMIALLESIAFVVLLYSNPYSRRDRNDPSTSMNLFLII